MSKSPNNVFVFHGEDDFSLSKKIERWKEEFAKKFSQSGVAIIDGTSLGEQEILNQLEQVAAPSLFASKKLVICKECLPTKAGQEDLTDFILKLIEINNPNNFFVFYSSKPLDRRLGATKKILASNATVTEFSLPHGINLNGWIKAYAKQMNIDMDNAAIDKLAVYLGRDLFEEKKFGGRTVEVKEAYDLWQAYSELQKLAGLGQKISSSNVAELVVPKVSENVFELSDAIFSGNKGVSARILENLFSDQSTDEKATAIKITALLAEQTRAGLLVSLLKQKKLDNQGIAEALGWSSGRVFMVSKQLPRVDLEKFKAMLKELLGIDSALKSSDTNPRLLLNLFVTKFAV